MLMLKVEEKSCKCRPSSFPDKMRALSLSSGYGRLLSERAAGRLSRKPAIYQIADGVGFDTYGLRMARCATVMFCCSEPW